MMATYSKNAIFFLSLLLSGAVFLAPVFGASDFPVRELYKLINRNESTLLISYDDLLKETQNLFFVSGYKNTGFLINNQYYGFSYTQKDNTDHSEMIDIEMTKTLASRAIFIPEILKSFSKTGLPKILKKD